MTSLTVHTSCQYLTTGGEWREVDYKARVIVKCLKGKPFKGYCELILDDGPLRLDEKNMDAGLDKAGLIIASRLRELVDQKIVLVPVPNSNGFVGSSVKFRTLALAQAVAGNSTGLASANPAILWKSEKSPQHKGSGYRHATHYLPNLAIVNRVSRPVVLIDDVINSGSQMLACAHLLRQAGAEVLFGMAVARTTSVQTPQALEWVSDEIAQAIP